MSAERTPEGYLVPDVLAPGLTLVLVGTAPSQISARARAYYANPSNKFWASLFQAGITPRQFQPREYPELLALGVGLTDVAKRHSGVDAALPDEAWAPTELQEKIRTYAPRLVAFTSKRAASEATGVPTGRIPYGLQAGSFEGAEPWVLPSPSPLGHNHFQIGPWVALGERYRALRGS
ncbi:mismatch-specific DNA-glycosylase [Deinococcus maricopensis]|uniref:Uracil-DNA glycosylase superfamily n=1 Tax=Deinococcus maricopensis (strain DSM 21211 / LMG 22137 / NRRL B-23946 / LB-34) TaxID=709986 RepID=E8UB69_DEIML|nr:mismatch-specific DNA-glycosylase [Deinococcus maricopensis]ADV68308.1 Uracil-DNA glycosylase superfamily [Deinococcus maricopensis DSM 21211]